MSNFDPWFTFDPLRVTLQSLAVPFILAIALGVLVAATAWMISKQDRFFDLLLYYTGFGIPVGVAAFAAGFLTGVSRQPAVGAVLPAILALIAGVNVYVFGTESRHKAVVGYCVGMLSFMLLWGAETGSHERVLGREAYLLSLSQQEFRIRNFRQNLDLHDDMPAWLSGEDSK